MSQRTKSWVVTTLTIFVAMVLSATVSIPAASAATGDPIIPTTPTCTVTLVSGDPSLAPAPTCYDPSGSDIDEFLVPHYYDANGNSVVYDNGEFGLYNWDRPNPTNGASQVFVQSMYYDPAQWMYVNGPAWTLTFNTAVTAAPGANSYWASVGDCQHSYDDVRPVTAWIRNEAGVDGRYISSVYPESWSEEITVAETVAMSRVYDGSTNGTSLLVDQNTPGLFTGQTYTIRFWLADAGNAMHSTNPARRLGGIIKVFVPKCGTSASPSNRPSARIVKLKPKPPFSKAKVVLGSRSVTKTTKYRVVVNPKVGKTVRTTVVTKHKVLRFKLRGGGVVKVRLPNGKVVRKRV